MAWSEIQGEVCLQCASEGCKNEAAYRLEVGGVGSVYCPACRAKIEAQGDRLKQFRDWLVSYQQPALAGTDTIHWLDPKDVLKRFDAATQPPVSGSTSDDDDLLDYRQNGT